MRQLLSFSCMKKIVSNSFFFISLQIHCQIWWFYKIQHHLFKRILRGSNREAKNHVQVLELNAALAFFIYASRAEREKRKYSYTCWEMPPGKLDLEWTWKYWTSMSRTLRKLNLEPSKPRFVLWNRILNLWTSQKRLKLELNQRFFLHRISKNE